MEIKQVYELNSQYNNQKSFYGKAKIIEYKNGDKDLISYTTKVASIINNKLFIYGYYSNTTARHINEFLLQHGFKKMSKAEILAY